LRDKKAILEDNYTIRVNLENKVQEEVFNEDKSNILGFIKTHLKNDEITVQVTVTPVKEEEMKAYTAEDKFKKMVKKNPDLGILKDKFDLEIDF
jgi:hypothetical protein